MVSLRFALLFLPLAILTACAAQPGGPLPQEKPTPPPRPQAEAPTVYKPAYQSGRTAFLHTLNAARLLLVLHDGESALQALDRLRHLADEANRVFPDDSELSAKVVFTREGVLRTMLVGLDKGQGRYDRLLNTLNGLKERGIEPKEVTLVRIPSGLSKGLILAELREAESIIQRLGAADPDRAFIEADRPLEKLYTAMEAKQFDDAPEIRLQLYLWLSRELLSAKYYALSRDTLNLANAACEDYALQEKAPAREEVAAYRGEMASLEKALKHRDPGMMSKLGGALREAWYGLRN